MVMLIYFYPFNSPCPGEYGSKLKPLRGARVRQGSNRRGGKLHPRGSGTFNSTFQDAHYTTDHSVKSNMFQRRILLLMDVVLSLFSLKFYYRTHL